MKYAESESLLSQTGGNDTIYWDIKKGGIPERTDTIKNKFTKVEIKTRLFGEQKGKCRRCSALFEFRHFHVDHIIPKSRGGRDNLENLQLLCGSCNNIKGSKDMEYLKIRLKQVC